MTSKAQKFNLLPAKNDSVKTKVSWVSQDGWSKNSINTVVFRKNALVSNKKYQFMAYYDQQGYLILGRRKLKSKKWITEQSSFQIDPSDAHKSISIMLDGNNYLHVAWGQHDNALNYVRSIEANGLTLGEKQAMTDEYENKVTYPEFYPLPNGNLLFFYREGSSGNGNLVIKLYDLLTKTWTTIQKNLIDGQGQRNAYLQTFVDPLGRIHISWVWRESPNVSSNHDMCYARSDDGGKSWLKSNGQAYSLPITIDNAEYVAHIPQNSELINQTSMYADSDGTPYISSYWRKKGSMVPQYHILYLQDGSWKDIELQFRTTAFTLSGGGTKSIPIARPQLIAWNKKKRTNLALIFRDAERQNKISAAITNGLDSNSWHILDLYSSNVGEWEPSYDQLRWRRSNTLDLFLQEVEQVDGEGKADRKPTPVGILSWKPE